MEATQFGQPQDSSGAGGVGPAARRGWQRYNVDYKYKYIYDEKKAEDKMVQNGKCSGSSVADGSLAFGVIRLVIAEDIDPVRELGVRRPFKSVIASLWRCVDPASTNLPPPPPQWPASNGMLPTPDYACGVYHKAETAT
ncbi:hypothetical protein PISMIDRAFT_16469 [Pisolithus microcarpus 441]|uniref:Uncharacterized protein n=1 Tax=Pisolithus microcarpus 441 TaxID=765257 RepID=A0A0C9YNZ2_9AGAM|nr:hypothetical protein BKA83DRAFT_16469 [Pisolithus microcarpus]KIK15499.1 hypothetical protein PISMIDRAFT_16469 [Pisolithus microcarpus 441]